MSACIANIEDVYRQMPACIANIEDVYRQMPACIANIEDVYRQMPACIANIDMFNEYQRIVCAIRPQLILNAIGTRPLQK